MKKNRGIIRSITSKVWLISILFLFLLVLLGFSFPNYLFQLQTRERLLKIKDYTEYKLNVVEQVRPEFKKRFSFNGIDYYYDGIEEINIMYGSTKTTFENVLMREYLSLDDFLMKTTNEGDNEEETVYAYRDRPSKDVIFYIIKKKNANEVILRMNDKDSQDETKEETQQE